MEIIGIHLSLARKNSLYNIFTHSYLQLFPLGLYPLTWKHPYQRIFFLESWQLIFLKTDDRYRAIGDGGIIDWCDLTKVISILNYNSRNWHIPAGNRTRASRVGGEHSRKEPFEQLDKSYLEHIHMSAWPVENARDNMNFVTHLWGTGPVEWEPAPYPDDQESGHTWKSQNKFLNKLL